MNKEELLELAINAREHAQSPTGYYVGAAILTKDGKVYTGCNLGSEDGLFNICAERVAIIKMLSEGVNANEVEKIMVVGGPEDQLIYTAPCGICRQFLLEYAKDASVICGYIEGEGFQFQTYTVEELLPYGFEIE